MLGIECNKLGGNAVLSVNFEMKQFGDKGSYMIIACNGMACTIIPRPSHQGQATSRCDREILFLLYYL